MSEFTSGYVLLASDKDKLEASLKALDAKGTPYILHQLNAKYLGLFIDFTGTNQFYKTWEGDCSKELPILYFYNAEDHGWGYRLYTNGQEASQISVHYAIDYRMVCELIEQELGHEGAEYHAKHSGELDAYYIKIRSSIAYKQAIEAMYTQLNLASFIVFDLEEDKIKQLEAILNPRFYEAGRWKQVFEFKELIGIREMEWKSYRYLKRDQDEGKSND